MAFFYPFPYTGGVNSDVLTEQLNAVHPAVDGFNTNTAGIITVVATTELDQTTQDALAAVIAAHDPNVLTQQQEIEAARVALSEIRQYLNQQLVKVSPASPADQVTAIKAIANGNTFLARIMTNQIAAMNGAFGWSLTNNPTTNPTRLQYIVTVELLTGVLPQA